MFNDVAQNFYVFASLGLVPVLCKFYPYYKDNLPDKENDLLGRSFVKALMGFILVAIASFIFEPLVIRKFSARSALFVEYYFWVLPYAFGLLFFSLLEGYAWAITKNSVAKLFKETGIRLFTTLFIAPLFFAHHKFSCVYDAVFDAVPISSQLYYALFDTNKAISFYI